MKSMLAFNFVISLMTRSSFINFEEGLRELARYLPCLSALIQHVRADVTLTSCCGNFVASPTTHWHL